MNKSRKETFIRATSKRRDKLIESGKKRLDTYIKIKTLDEIDKLKKEKALNTRGDVLDFVFNKIEK